MTRKDYKLLVNFFKQFGMWEENGRVSFKTGDLAGVLKIDNQRFNPEKFLHELEGVK